MFEVNSPELPIKKKLLTLLVTLGMEKEAEEFHHLQPRNVSGE